MKKLILSAFILPAVLFSLASCHEAVKEDAEAQLKSTQVLLQETTPPENLAMSEDTLYSRILREANETAEALKSEMIDEALTSVLETQSILQSIKEGNQPAAEDKTHELIGKLNVIVAAHPDLALLPVDARVDVQETVTDLATVEALTKEIEQAVDRAYYQLARELLEGLVSEVQINTVYIPLATYPEGLKQVGVLLRQNKLKDAAFLLEGLLNTLVIEERILPLPVLKAQQLVDATLLLNTEDEADRALAINYLSNAEYQLKMAEALGYGKHNKDYKSLYEAIKSLEKGIRKEETKEEIKASLEQLKKDLRNFREKYFSRKSEK